MKIKEPRAIVAANLRGLRVRHGLSQEQLADALAAAGVLDWTQATIADIELGQRHLRADEALALALFFRVGLEQILAPQRGRVRLGSSLVADQETLTAFLRERGVRRIASRVLPQGRGVEAYSGLRLHAPVTTRLERELQDWEAAGGDPSELRAQRDRLWRGALSSQQYAAWKRHAKARLDARAANPS